MVNALKVMKNNLQLQILTDQIQLLCFSYLQEHWTVFACKTNDYLFC
jgi:hypothetical protein